MALAKHMRHERGDREGAVEREKREEGSGKLHLDDDCMWEEQS